MDNNIEIIEIETQYKEYEFELDNLYNHEYFIRNFLMDSYKLDKIFVNSINEIKHYYFKFNTKYKGYKKNEYNRYLAKYLIKEEEFNNESFNKFFSKFREFSYIWMDYDMEEKRYIIKDFPIIDDIIDNKTDEYIDGKVYTVFNDDEDVESLRNIIKHMNEIIDITDNNIIPYRLCQIYGYMNYDNFLYLLELDPEGDEYLHNDKILINFEKNLLDEDNKGSIFLEHDAYFIIDNDGNLDEIELIPNKYGVIYGFNTYYELINNKNWDLPMLISPFEKIDFKTMKIDKLYEI